MADLSTDDPERGATIEEPRAERGARRGSGVALADEGADELPALLAIVVGIAILVVALIWPAIRDDDTSVDAGAAATEEEEAAPEPEEAVPATGIDVPTIQALLDSSGIEGLAVSADGSTLVLTGEVADEDTRNLLIDVVSVQPGVEEVDATGLVVVAPEPDDAPAPATPAVEVTAAQVSIVVEGTVPDEATRDALVARAAAVYSAEQVDDRLVVDASVTPPITVNIGGAMTDPVLFDQVATAFEGIDGIEVDASGFALEESSDLEAALNGLDPIQFGSGSATLEPASGPILDEAAALLADNPDVALEIGGHTDSIGGEEGNQVLSEDRAQAVLDALRERGVENDLSAVGFGERRLKVSPDDDDLDAQRENRRIEFRITS